MGGKVRTRGKGEESGSESGNRSERTESEKERGERATESGSVGREREIEEIKKESKN